MRKIEEHFWRQVNKNAASGCWVWIGSTARREYGRFYAAGKYVVAHRFSWELANGSIPVGMQVCHKCDNPPCVRPDHLFIGTQSDNLLDCVAKGRQCQTRKTHCPQGHLYNETNTFISPSSGGRQCKECHRRRERAKSRGLTGMVELLPAQTHCKQGHPFDADNTFYISTRPGRWCRACSRINAKKNYERLKSMRTGLLYEVRAEQA